MFQIYKGQFHGGKVVLSQEKTYDLLIFYCSCTVEEIAHKMSSSAVLHEISSPIVF